MPTKPKKTAADWKKRRVHEDVTLPSGAQVDITIPNLAQLIESGSLPNKLIPVAVSLQSANKLSEDVLKDAWEFAKFIVPTMVVNPALEPADVDDIPYEDVELLIAFATRATDMDAVGKHLGGLHTVQSFRDLRGIFTTDPDLLGDEGGGSTSS